MSHSAGLITMWSVYLNMVLHQEAGSVEIRTLQLDALRLLGWSMPVRSAQAVQA